ncbi:MAG: hypothetical protein SOZ07_02170 [Prevotella sp.]|nr:hypothetical protein [Prevotella sp.]MDD7272916.1 hypothetical protein [Prevotellaceae bacterium]MDY3935452.1 hypothetical protein [Prevotella sp.]MDY4217413.1 hypothetical protein [Prevotella sp.]
MKPISPMKIMSKTVKISRYILVGMLCASMSSCDDFVFGNVSINDEENPLIQKKTPSSGAEIYYGVEEGQHRLPVNKDADVSNPDPKGAFANWYTCLVMFKEGHSHYGGKMHGNAVYTKAAWRQEQFAEVHNTKSGIPEIVMDRHSIRTYLEAQRGEEGPAYFRIIGGASKLWALCLYFYDKEGKLLNDSILAHSDEYQIFFSISDVDDKKQQYKVMDVRYRDKMPATGVIDGEEADCFRDKDSFEERQKMTPQLFDYTYRDTWTHQDMGDGVRDFFNIRLLPPLTNKDADKAHAEDQDCIGLKGHFKFDCTDYESGLDEREWPLPLSGRGFSTIYKRQTYLLPKFYLAIRVMKCPKGKKAVVPVKYSANSPYRCAPFYDPNPLSGWTEIIRINVPIKIYTNTFDSDPTNIDPYEPFYYHISREIGLSPEDAFEYVFSNSGSGGLGFDAWFL